MTEKHAYLIIAHGEFEILRLFIDLIDDIRNDIFVHFDKKCTTLPHIEVKKSNLFILKKRIDVRWADISLVETEMLLFEFASSNGKYSYYHLVSGVDMPIKSQDFIHEFCKLHGGKEFVGYINTPIDLSMTNRYHLLTRQYRPKNILSKAFFRVVRWFVEFPLNLIMPSRNIPFEIKKGCNWVSITDDFCRYLVSQKDLIMKVFSHTKFADERFLQSVLWYSPYRSYIYNLDSEYDSCLRCIDWNRGNPYVWKKEDVDSLLESSGLFARKFSEKNMDAVHIIHDKLLCQET